MKKYRHYEIGYFGRPIAEISREEALEAIVELAVMYKKLEAECKVYKARFAENRS